MKSKLYALLIVLAGVFWGTSCLFVHYLNENTVLNPMQITAIRLTFAAVLLNAVMLIRGKGFSLYRVSWRSLLLVAVSGISVYCMCQFYYSCMLETSAAFAVVLLNLAPIFVMLLSVIFFKERITPQKVIAFLFAICGCVLISGLLSGSRVSAVGILLGILGAFSYSLYGIFGTLFKRDNPNALAFTAWNFLFASAASLLVSRPWEIVAATQQTQTPWLTVAVYFLLAIFTAVFPFALYAKGLDGVKPDTASILAFSEPMTACLFGVFVLGQPMDLFGVVGILCVCVAIALLNCTPKRKS